MSVRAVKQALVFSVAMGLLVGCPEAESPRVESDADDVGRPNRDVGHDGATVSDTGEPEDADANEGADAAADGSGDPPDADGSGDASDADAGPDDAADGDDASDIGDANDGDGGTGDTTDGDVRADVAADTADAPSEIRDTTPDVPAPVCGDGTCERTEGCATCPSDCGVCPVICGDDRCDASETCTSCSGDCGECGTILTFGADFSETFSAPLVAGDSVTVRYDFARLPECRSSAAGLPAWSIQVFYTFDLAVPATALTPWERVGTTIVPRDVSFAIPSGATQVWLWAQNTDSSGCNRFDSNLDANYRLPVFAPTTVSTPPGFIGTFEFISSNRGSIARLGERNPAFYFSTMRESGIQTWVQFEVYAAGITDRDYSAPEVQANVATTAITAQVVTDAYGGGPPGQAQTAQPLRFLGRVGNNFVYQWFPLELLVPSVELGGLADGAYNYSFSVGTARQATPAVFGRIDGVDRVYVLSRTLNCALFPFNPPTSDGCP